MKTKGRDTGKGLTHQSDQLLVPAEMEKMAHELLNAQGIDPAKYMKAKKKAKVVNWNDHTAEMKPGKTDVPGSLESIIDEEVRKLK